MNLDLIDFIADVLRAHVVNARALVDEQVVFTCTCGWSGPAGTQFRRHIASKVMGAALSATSQVHGENLARTRQDTAENVAMTLATQLEAMMRLLVNTGDMTPMGARQLRRVLIDVQATPA